MITLRLNIDEVNGLYNTLDWSINENKKAGNDVSATEVLRDYIKSVAERDVESWDGYVTNEVNTVLESLLPEAESGNIGIVYDKPILEQYDTGPVFDEGKANGVNINIVLKFKDTIQIK